MPYDTYRLYQTERVKHPTEIRCADEHAAQVAAAVSWLFRRGTLAVRAVRRPRINPSSAAGIVEGSYPRLDQKAGLSRC